MTTINSATGAETLPGTSGADLFVYDDPADSGTTYGAADVITFNRAQGDKIDLRALPLTGANKPASLTFLGVEPSGSKAFGIWQWSAQDGGQIRIDLNGDGSADMAISLSDPNLVLQASDFILADPVEEPPPGGQTLNGTAGADNLTGGSGNDVITGGSDADVLTGGAGADVFRYTAVSDSTKAAPDTITDFVSGTDKIDLTALEAAIGHSLHFAGANDPSSGKEWGVWGWGDGSGTYRTDTNGDGSADMSLFVKNNGAEVTLTAADFVLSGTGGEGPPSGGEEPPPSGNGDIPAHTVVVHDTFDGGNSDWGHFTNRWGQVQHVFDGSDGGIRVTSPLSTHADAGAMWQGAGLGYGLYEFTIKANTSAAPGPYALLWPQDDNWPGPELDVAEQLPGGRVYSTIHYNKNGDDAYDSYFAPDSIRLTDKHTFAMNWQQDFIDVFVDGVRYAHITKNVPRDAAHGGLNSLPGVGEQTWWSAAQQTGDNSLTLYDFKYSVIA